MPDQSLEIAVAPFRLSIGHDFLQAHLYRIGHVDSPLYTLCDSRQPMMTDHQDECEALELFL